MRWIVVVRKWLLRQYPQPACITPEWEPVPWDAGWRRSNQQRTGFRRRARQPLVWTQVHWNNFPSGGIFGKHRDWFVEHDIEYVSTLNDEDLILIRHAWSGFPDPPEWSLASRPRDDPDAPWARWGSFDQLPAAWRVEDSESSTPSSS